MSSREPPSPWKSTSAGQPPAGGVPSGSAERRGERRAVRRSSRSCPGVANDAGRVAEWSRRSATTTTSERGQAAHEPERRRTGWRRYDHPRDGRAADRRLRLGRGRPDRPARVSRDDAARGRRLPRRQRAAAVRAAAARRDPPLRARDRRLARGAGREARRRRLQLCDRSRASRPAACARGARRRRARTRRRTPPCSRRGTGGSACSRRRRPSRAVATRRSSTRSTRASTSTRARLPDARPADRRRRSRTARRRPRPSARSPRRSKTAGVDTVILGCTHYPLIRPILQRVFGRDVTLVFSADETAREVAETLARKGIENGDGREGSYPLPHDRRPGRLPRDGPPVPPAADRRGRAGRRSPRGLAAGCPA